MISSIIANWLFGIGVDKFRLNKKIQRSILALMLIFNVGLIFIFKYLVFTLKNFNLLFEHPINIPSIALPIGISFFTFQSISYVVDVYRKNGEVQKNPAYVGLYISLFPQLIAGPIVRYQTVVNQIKERNLNWSEFNNGVERFIIGLAKKVLLANNMAIIADKAFNLPNNELTSPLAWIGAIAYTLQIYYDFSGYSDMAIGLGKIFGFNFYENFNFPYISKSISEFWRRWHISLGTWFRDYIYIPLGGNRVGNKGRHYFNLFIVWFLTGVWHGANWTFICWGLLYFVVIIFEKLTNFEKINNINIIKHVYTLLVTIFAFVIFRSDTLGDAFDYMKTMFVYSPVINSNTLYAINDFKYFFIASIGFSIPYTSVSKFLPKKNIPFLREIFIFLLFILSISSIMKGSYNPFIYFNF